MDIIKNWILKNVLGACAEFFQQVLSAFGDAIDGVFVKVAEVNYKMTDGITNFTLAFSLFFIIALALKQYFSVYVMETEGDPDADPLDIFVRASQAVAFAVCSDSIFDFFMDFSSVFVQDATAFTANNLPDGASTVTISSNLNQLLSVPTDLIGIPAVVILVAISMIIAIVIVVIMAGIRGAELMLFRMLFPLFAADLVTTQRERWNGFFTSYVVTWLSYGIQIMCYKMFAITLSSFIAVDVSAFWTMFALCIGWLVLMLRAPRWLEKFAYSSGIANGMKSSIYMVGYGMRMRG